MDISPKFFIINFKIVLKIIVLFKKTMKCLIYPMRLIKFNITQ